jgi:transmembrane 9 superfamily member 2/4
VLTVDYDPRFHFCRPANGPKKQSESLGSILFGDRIFSSPISVKMLENSTCEVLCQTEIPAPTEEGDGDGVFINELIQEGYSMNWLIDGLPAARIRIDAQTEERFYSFGFELGFVDTSGEPILNNHYDIIVDFHVLPLPEGC